MANFNPPFSTGADKRLPTSDERQQGFDCGPADRELFNGLFFRLESEIGSVVSHAGITQTDDRHTLLREAIEALIDAATGGGDPDQFLLMTQARTRLPIYPEVLSADGRITIIPAGAGAVRVPGGVSFLHRGIFPINTAQTDFATVASKTYHLRWNPTDGFQLKDVSDLTYNPATLPEADQMFDTGFDDMLVARVITNSGNVATITNLANKNQLWWSQNTGRLTDLFLDPTNQYGSFGARRNNNTFTYGWGRTPRIDSINVVVGALAPGQPMGIHGAANAVFNKSLNRYRTVFDVNTDFYAADTSLTYAEIDFRVMG